MRTGALLAGPFPGQQFSTYAPFLLSGSTGWSPLGEGLALERYRYKNRATKLLGGDIDGVLSKSFSPSPYIISPSPVGRGYNVVGQSSTLLIPCSMEMQLARAE